MKTFRTQYVECKKAKLVGLGPIQKFKDHPDMLPVPWHKAAKVIAEHLKKDPEFGLRTLTCKKFGGQCYGGNPRCMALRAVPDFLKGKKVVVGYHTMLGKEGEGFFGQLGGAEWAEQVADALNVLQRIATSKEQG
jgi:hypothetical protein